MLQPPSGGCELKRNMSLSLIMMSESAAFGRLRVETAKTAVSLHSWRSAAFGRLRVETLCYKWDLDNADSAAFRRLQV